MLYTYIYTCCILLYVGNNHIDAWTAMNTVANYYRAKGLNDRAEYLYKQCYQYRIDNFGLQHYDTKLIIENLVSFYKEIGKDSKADQLLEACKHN